MAAASIGLGDLPNELLLRVMESLDSRTLCRLAGVCRRIRLVANEVAAALLRRMAVRSSIGVEDWDSGSPVLRWAGRSRDPLVVF